LPELIYKIVYEISINLTLKIVTGWQTVPLRVNNSEFRMMKREFGEANSDFLSVNQYRRFEQKLPKTPAALPHQPIAHGLNR
jgi:hypothetical protein